MWFPLLENSACPSLAPMLPMASGRVHWRFGKGEFSSSVSIYVADQQPIQAPLRYVAHVPRLMLLVLDFSILSSKTDEKL